MSAGQKNDSLIDFSGNINVQLCATVKLTDPEFVHVSNTVCTLDISRRWNAVKNP